MSVQFDWYNKDTYGCGWPKKKQARIRLMDAGTGLMNRKLQGLIRRMYSRLKEKGLIESNIDLESINMDLSTGKDFYSLTFGKQVRKYLQFVDDFEKDGTSLSTIVSDRNYFIHKYYLEKTEESDVTDGELDRLEKLILTIEKASNRFDGKIKQIQSESKKKINTIGDGQNRVKSIIDRQINKAGGSTDLAQVSTVIQKDVKGFDSEAVLGMKLCKFVRLHYDVSGSGNEMIIRIRPSSKTSKTSKTLKSSIQSKKYNAVEEDIRRLTIGIVTECRDMKNPSAEIGQRLKKIPGLKYSQYGGKDDLKSFLNYFNIRI